MDIANITAVNYSKLQAPVKQSDEAVPEEPVPVITEEDVINGGEPTQTVSEEPKGVLRLLTQGHFKGVAEVRLRINFHEELHLREQEVVERTTQEISDFKEILETQLATVAGSVGLTEQQVDHLQELGDAFISGLGYSQETAVDVQTSVSAIQSAFSSLQSSLLQLSDQAEDSRVLDELLEGLSAAFDQLLANVDALPSIAPLSAPPDNHGSAYGKFLSLYQELLTPSQANQGHEGLDVEA